MTETTEAPAQPLEPTDEQRAAMAYFDDLRDRFAASALTALLPLSLSREVQQSKLVGSNGRPQGVTVGFSAELAEWACDAAYDIAGMMLRARRGQLPRQLARTKALADAADAASSPAAPILAGPGAGAA